MNLYARNFLKEFGQMLMPAGFFMYNSGFYKLNHVEGMLFSVTTSDAMKVVSYNVLPFCHSISTDNLKGGFYQVNALWYLYGNQIDTGRLTNDVYCAEITARVFRKSVLERFLAIQNLRDYQSFRDWHYYELYHGKTGMEYWHADAMWEYIQLEEYALAQAAESLTKERYQSLCETNPHRRDEARAQEFLRMDALFEHKDFQKLQELLHARIEKSKDTCRTYLGMASL